MNGTRHVLFVQEDNGGLHLTGRGFVRSIKVSFALPPDVALFNVSTW